ncbi:MAG: hypothetical protein ACRC28_13865, partial [Clostridium sp.]|uniref:hypothetical protein n=1 Tax=Clostridium sp. TaxID=1506 RepID=UPI003F3F9920
DYDFTVDPVLGTKLSRTIISNNADTKINNATFKNGAISKTVDKLFADLNQVLTYTVTLTNTGNVTATNVVLLDNLDPSLLFNNNSVIIDGLPTGGVNPLLGIPLSDIAAGQTVVVGFKATVISIPATNSIPNIATVDYKYSVSALDDTIGSDSSSEIFSVISRAIISNDDGSLVKTSVSNYADVGDVVTYSIIMDNTGNSIASSMFIIDTVPNGMTFIPGTFKINGIAFPDYDPNVGCDIGNLSPTGGKVVTFDVTVDTIPVNPVENVASLSYKYTVDPANPNGAGTTNLTNIFPITVNHGLISPMAKGSDVNFAKKGNTINYTITIPNAGNVDITNVILKDTIPFGTSLVPNSLLVSGVLTPGNIQTGINIGTIGVGAFKTVSFTLKVDTIPDSRIVENQAVATFNYTADPSMPNGKTGGAVTNVIQTDINQAIIDPAKGDLIKLTSKKYALVGDTVTYTVVVRNSGNVTADTVEVRDVLALSTSFIPGTVKVNNVPKASENPNTGINAGSLGVDGVTTVTFDVKVNTIPTGGVFQNEADVDYTYILDPINGINSRDTATTAPINVYVNQAGVIASDGSFKITVDKAFAEIGEVIEYTITLNNYGNADIYDALVLSTIPDGTSLVPNSVKVNNVVVAANPMSSIDVGTIPKGTTTTIKYKVLVDTLPLVNPLLNSATAEYVFTLNPSNPKSEYRAQNTGTVKTTVNQAIVGVVKSVDKPYVKIGDIAKYSFVLKNTGNVDANSVTIYDTIPTGTIFVGNTVKVNGVVKTGVSPNTGIIIPKIAAGGTSNVEFQVQIQGFPNGGTTIPNASTTEYNYIVDPSNPNGVIKNTQSNNVDMVVRDPDIKANNNTFIKSVNKDYAVVDETVTYTLVIKNMGNARATNILVTDTIPTYTSFVQDSVYINGIQSLGTNPSQGISIATIDPGEILTITFDVLVNSIPPSNSIPNSAKLKYNFTVNPSNIDQESVTISSNAVSTNIREANISVIKGGLSKTVNKAFADLQEVIDYTISMTNLGNVTAENVTLFDTIPTGATLVPNSVKLNGSVVNLNPTSGILVGNLLPNENAIVEFSVEVGTLPQPNPINNVGMVSYSYRATDTSTAPVSRTSFTQTVSTKINSAIVTLNLDVDKPQTIIGDTLEYTAKIKNEGNATASDVIFYGTIPEGTTLIPTTASFKIVLESGEVLNNAVDSQGISTRTTVNGNPANGDPINGVIIGQLPPGAQVIVVYDVLVVSIPSSQKFLGGGTVTFAYTVNPSTPNGSSGSTNAQIPPVTTISDPQITVANGSLTKYVDKNYAKVTDTLNYSIVLSNPGNVAADNVVIKDTLPQGTLLVQDSITVNGVPQVGLTNLSNLNIGTIDIGNTVTVTFEVVVVMIPWDNPIPNSAYVTYDFNAGVNSRQINTNEVLTQVNFADISTITGGILKSVDKAYGKIGEEVTYSIDIVNNGNVDASNVMVIDTLPDGLEFIANSVIINSVAKPGASPDAGIWLGVVNPAENINIKFKGKIIKIPTVNPMSNDALINYDYTIDPNLLNGEAVWNKSNSVKTKVNDVTFSPDDGSFIKIVDKPVSDINSNINYTIVVKNTGNVSALGAVVKDVVSTDTPVVPGSLMVNGVSILNGDLTTGLNIGNVNIGKTVTIQFTVMATSLPTTNPVLNKATIDYLFVKDPLNEPNGETATGTTNETNIQIKTAGPLFSGVGGFYKEFSKDYAKLGDCVVCKFEIPNNGNIPMKNVVLIDTISPYLQFTTGSIYIDGINNTTNNPNTGIVIGDIEPGEVKEVLFKTTVTSIPMNNPIENVGTINYNYSIDGARVTTQASLMSNYDYLNILQAILAPNFKKEVDKTYAELGDILTYKITVVNTGNTDALNVKITDLLPPEVELVANSVEINCVETSDADVESGIIFSDLPPDMIKIITFKVKVVKIPMDGMIDNKACINYSYIVDPNEQPIVEDACTEYVQTSVKSGDLTCTKESNVAYGTLGTEVTYKITLENIGNTQSEKVFLKDILPSELTVKPGSLKRDGNSIPGNILNGINLGTINASSIVNIEFVGVVNSVPKVNPINNKANVSYEVTLSPTSAPIKKNLDTNTVPLTIKNGVLVLTKGSSVFKAIVGDTIDYQIVAKNTGNTPIINVNITDLLPPELEFVANSLTVNGVSKAVTDLKSGYQINSIGVGEVVTLTYKAVIKGTNDLGIVENTAKGSYVFVIGETPVNSPIPPSSNAMASGEAISNTVKITVEEISQLMSKTANKSEVAIGGVIGYTVSVENTGTIDMLNVTLMDSIPVGTSLIPSSFKVNGISKLWPIVGNILVGEVAQIYYEVKVNSYIENIIENRASIKFNYRLNPTDSLKVGYSSEVISYVTLISPNFTQLSFDGNFTLPCNKDDILSVTEVNAEVEIISSDVISTPSGISESNFTLTGNKLVVTAIAKIVVEYISNTPTKTLGTVAYEKLFTRYIVLPDSYTLVPDIEVNSIIEDLYAVEVGSREIFFNLTIFLYAGL